MNSPSSSPSSTPDCMEEIEKCLSLLRKHKLNTVVFDMDQTAVAEHSRGVLKRSEVDEFAAKASPAFVGLVRALHGDGGFHLAIATHSDQAEFETGRKAHLIDRATNILGEELVAEMLQRCFSEEIASSFFVVAYNPRAHAGAMDDPRMCVKRHHMREIQKHYDVTADDIVFFDDVPNVVEDCVQHCKVKGVLVDASKGFQLGDLINALTDG